MLDIESLSAIRLDVPPFLIAGHQYAGPRLSINNSMMSLAMAEIEGLRQVLISPGAITFALSFPFDCSREYRLNSTSVGFTRQHLIDEVRRAYRAFYRMTPKPAVTWETSGSRRLGGKHLCVYNFSEIYVLSLGYNDAKRRLYVEADGLPFPDNGERLPF